MVAAVSYLLAARAQIRRPKLLVLRRFGDKHVETFLSQAAGGLSIFARPLWMYDARAHPWIRKYLPSPALYLTRTIVWLALGFAIVGRAPGRLTAEVLWVAWMAVGTSVYHRYKAGHSPTAWISCIGALILFNITVPPLREIGATLQEGVIAAAIFVALWAALAVAVRKTSMRRLFRRMYERPQLSSTHDLTRFHLELEQVMLRPRYCSVAPIQVMEIVCDTALWGAAIYHAIGASSIIIADITNVEDSASIVWELRQARLAGVPILLTCEAQDIGRATGVITRQWGAQCMAFAWHCDDQQKLGIRYDAKHLSDSFFALVRSHLKEELSYLPLRPSLETALEELATLDETGKQSAVGNG